MRLPVKRIQRILRMASRYEWRGLHAVMRATVRRGSRVGFAAHRAGELADRYFHKARSLRQWVSDMQESYGAETKKRTARLHQQIREARLTRAMTQKPASRPKVSGYDLF